MQQWYRALVCFAVNSLYSWAVIRKIVSYDPLLKGSLKLSESSLDDTIAEDWHLILFSPQLLSHITGGYSKIFCLKFFKWEKDSSGGGVMGEGIFPKLQFYVKTHAIALMSLCRHHYHWFTTAITTSRVEQCMSLTLCMPIMIYINIIRSILNIL